MKYNFSSEFLKITSPNTSFGKAWEAFCYDLLAAEYGYSNLQRFESPDTGIDILHRSVSKAYQCKSNERGALGTLSATESIKSLRAAIGSKETFGWNYYIFATNANYTGNAIRSILQETQQLGIDSEQIDFLGPEYWSNLCEKHYSKVSHNLDYRISVTEEQVKEAFKKARYYDEYINKYTERISHSSFIVKIKNNLTPVELEIPFAPDLSVENCVDVVQELLGISLKWSNFIDLNTSTGPSISLTVNREGIPFSQKLGDLVKEKGDKDIVFWITIVWKDETREEAEDARHLYYLNSLSYDFKTIDGASLSYSERKLKTLERARTMLQTMIWSNVVLLKSK